MFEQMKWESVYELWQMGCCRFPKALTDPVSVETVKVEYGQGGCIYGYDWLETGEVQERKQLIQKDPDEFLYFTKPTNKGTIRTAEMLVEARDEEELAAIWIAATARELSQYDVGWYADLLDMAACEFLGTRYFLWHHAMKKLVPEIMIPSTVLRSMNCKDARPVMGLIQLNTLLLKSNWSILKYCSLEDGTPHESRCRISPK